MNFLIFLDLTVMISDVLNYTAISGSTGFFAGTPAAFIQSN